MMQNSFVKGLKDGLPICFGYFSVAFAFGIFAVGQGLSAWQTVAVSLANVTSAGQLAGVPIMVGGLPFLEMAATQLIINLRYALMSVSLSQKVASNVSIVDRLIISFVNTDEVFAVASGCPGMVGRNYLYGLILTPYIGWSFGTAVGAVAGNVLPAIVISALGIAIYGMFVAIVVPAMRKDRAVLGVTFCAVGLSTLFRYAPGLRNLSAGMAIVVCAVAASALFAWLRPLEAEGEEAPSHG